MIINQGCRPLILLFYLSTLLISFNLRAEGPVLPEESSNAEHVIEEGWVEKKIAPSTQWIENAFAPFTQWMESGIQQEPDNQAIPSADNSSNHSLISVQQAINTVLEKHPGKILRNQFKTGPPPYYKIKILSDKGTVSAFNVHAFSGKLFTLPDLTIKTEEAKP